MKEWRGEVYECRVMDTIKLHLKSGGILEYECHDDGKSDGERPIWV